MNLKETARDWLRQCLAWDFAEKQRLARAAMATGMGFSPEQYARPFPGSATTISVREAAGAGKILGGIVLAVLLGGTGFGAWNFWQASKSEKQPEWRWEYRIGKGPWKPITPIFHGPLPIDTPTVPSPGASGLKGYNKLEDG